MCSTQIELLKLQRLGLLIGKLENVTLMTVPPHRRSHIPLQSQNFLSRTHQMREHLKHMSKHMLHFARENSAQTFVRDVIHIVLWIAEVWLLLDSIFFDHFVLTLRLARRFSATTLLPFIVGHLETSCTGLFEKTTRNVNFNAQNHFSCASKCNGRVIIYKP